MGQNSISNQQWSTIQGKMSHFCCIYSVQNSFLSALGPKLDFIAGEVMQQSWPIVPPPSFENVQKEAAFFCRRLPFLALFHHPARNEMANDVIYFWVKFGPIPCDVVPLVYIFWTEQIIIISFARMSILRQDNVFIIKFSVSPRKFFGAKLTETA